MKQFMESLCIIPAILGLFDNTNVTTDSDLSDEMKTFYNKVLLQNAEPLLVHDQFGQKVNIPKSGGKTIEFRKYDTLPKALKPLTEGVTPAGTKLKVTKITATVDQFGDYVELSDVLILTAIDNNIVQATKLLGSQAGRTLDTITREIINAGTNVQYGAGEVVDRSLLVGGEASGNIYLSTLAIKKAVKFLKDMNAQKIGTDFVAIVHPDTAFDLTNDPKWEDPHKYVDTKNIYEGEIGKLHGVRFVESTEAKIFHAANLTAEARNLSIKTATTGSASATLAVKEAISADEATALAGREVIISGVIYEVVEATAGAAGSATIKIDEAIEVAADVVVYPGEAGAKGRDVYSTLVIGANAYGVTSVEGGGLQHIIKQLGSAGTADPLNQRATVGWKALKTAEILSNQYMVRVETCATSEFGAN